MAFSDVDRLLELGIGMIEKELISLQREQISGLGKNETDRLLECMRTLIVIRKDWRLAEKENVLDTKGMGDDEIEAAILEEAEKIKERKKKRFTG